MASVQRRSGQTGTEYMLVISVIVVAIAAAAYVYMPSFRSGTDALARDVSTILDTHQIGGVGVGAPPGNGGVGGPSANGNGTTGGPSPNGNGNNGNGGNAGGAGAEG